MGANMLPVSWRIFVCDWLERNYKSANPFHGAIKKEIATNMNHNAKYVDIMLFKKRDYE